MSAPPQLTGRDGGDDVRRRVADPFLEPFIQAWLLHRGGDEAEARKVFNAIRESPVLGDAMHEAAPAWSDAIVLGMTQMGDEGSDGIRAWEEYLECEIARLRVLQEAIREAADEKWRLEQLEEGVDPAHLALQERVPSRVGLSAPSSEAVERLRALLIEVRDERRAALPAEARAALATATPVEPEIVEHSPRTRVIRRNRSPRFDA